MKLILQPHTPEIATYFSDFQGTPMEEWPHVELSLDFNYGSKHDGERLQVHLTDEEAEEILNLLTKKGGENLQALLKEKNLK